MEIDEGARGKNVEIDRRGWKRKVTESHDFLFRWPVEPRLLGLTPWGQLSAIDSPASYTPDMPSHAKHRVTPIFARTSADTRAILHTTVAERPKIVGGHADTSQRLARTGVHTRRAVHQPNGFGPIRYAPFAPVNENYRLRPRLR